MRNRRTSFFTTCRQLLFRHLGPYHIAPAPYKMSADDNVSRSGRKRKYQQDPAATPQYPMGYAAAYSNPYGHWPGYGYPYMPYQHPIPPMAQLPGMAQGFYTPPPPAFQEPGFQIPGPSVE